MMDPVVENNFTSSRAEYGWSRFKPYYGHRVLDVGAGGSPEFYRKVLGSRYFAADANDRRSKPDVIVDFESGKLPVDDNSFDTVLCFDCLEHCENIHQLFDELVRASRQYVIVSLPNNWPTFIWSMLRGRNITHLGYGLPKDPQPPGFRHKWWFNLEEAYEFLQHRAQRLGGKVVETRFVYDTGNALIRIPQLYPDVYVAKESTIQNLVHREDLRAQGGIRRVAVDLARRLPGWVISGSIKALRVAFFPIKIADEILKRVIWGWGSRFRYLNVFCRQVWVVIDVSKKKPLSH